MTTEDLHKMKRSMLDPTIRNTNVVSSSNTAITTLRPTKVSIFNILAKMNIEFMYFTVHCTLYTVHIDK